MGLAGKRVVFGELHTKEERARDRYKSRSGRFECPKLSAARRRVGAGPHSVTSSFHEV